MHAYYAERAPYYDAVYLKPERQADIAFLSRHLPERLAGRSLLEVACGTGYWTQHIAPACAEIVATDGTAEPLEFARLRPAAQHAHFIQADAYALSAAIPPAHGKFNAAFAGLWFSHVLIENRSRFLASLHACLQPGARVIFIDNSLVQLNDFPITETDPQGNTYQRRATRNGALHRVLKNFPTESELRALIAPYSQRFEFRQLENFWLCEYELSAG